MAFQFLTLVRQTIAEEDFGWSVLERGENKWGILQLLTSLVWILFFPVCLIKAKYIGFLRVLCSNCHLATSEGAGVPWSGCWSLCLLCSETNTHTWNWWLCFVEGYVWRCSRHFCTKSSFGLSNCWQLTLCYVFGCVILYCIAVHFKVLIIVGLPERLCSNVNVKLEGERYLTNLTMHNSWNYLSSVVQPSATYGPVPCPVCLSKGLLQLPFHCINFQIYACQVIVFYTFNKTVYSIKMCFYILENFQ